MRTWYEAKRIIRVNLWRFASAQASGAEEIDADVLAREILAEIGYPKD